MSTIGASAQIAMAIAMLCRAMKNSVLSRRLRGAGVGVARAGAAGGAVTAVMTPPP